MTLTVEDRRELRANLATIRSSLHSEASKEHRLTLWASLYTLLREPSFINRLTDGEKDLLERILEEWEEE